MALLFYFFAALALSWVRNGPPEAAAGYLSLEVNTISSLAARAKQTNSTVSNTAMTIPETKWSDLSKPTTTTALTNDSTSATLVETSTTSATTSTSATLRPRPKGFLTSRGGSSKSPSKTSAKTSSRTAHPKGPKETGTLDDPSTVNATLWNPKISDSKKGPTFQIILSGVPNIKPGAKKMIPNTDVYDIDLFHTEKTIIDQLKGMNKTVICYFSAGTYEPGRPDTRKFVKADQGSRLPQWPREKWLKLGSTDVRRLMADRIQLASEKGCDAIDPDNIDGYAAGSGGGLGLKKRDSIMYIKFLSRTAAKYGLATGLKNALDIIKDVLPDVQFAVNEECVKGNECDSYTSFVKEKKPVFHIEYPVSDRLKAQDAISRQHWCAGRSSRGLKDSPWFQTVIKAKKLDGWVTFCDGSVATTPIHDTDGRYSNLRFLTDGGSMSGDVTEDPSDYIMTPEDEKIAREDGYPYGPGRGSESVISNEDLLDQDEEEDSGLY